MLSGLEFLLPTSKSLTSLAHPLFIRIDLTLSGCELRLSDRELFCGTLSEHGRLVAGDVTEHADELSVDEHGDGSPHRDPHDATPAERYDTEPTEPNVIQLPTPDEMTEPAYPQHAFVRKVGATGNIGFRGKLIQVGIRFAGGRVRVIEIERLVHIYHGDTLIRILTINPDRYYQPKPGKEPPTQRRSVT